MVLLGVGVAGTALIALMVVVSNGATLDAMDAESSADRITRSAIEPVGQVGGVTRVIVPDPNDASMAWMGVGPRVQAVDLSDPTSPRIVGRSHWLGVSEVVADIAFADRTLVALTESGTLHTLDASDPASPRLAARLQAPGVPDGFFTAGRRLVVIRGHAYVILDRKRFDRPEKSWAERRAIAVADIRDPEALAWVATDLLGPDEHVRDLIEVDGLLGMTTTREPRWSSYDVRNALIIASVDDPASLNRIVWHADTAWVSLATGAAHDRPRRIYGLGAASGSLSGGAIVADLPTTGGGLRVASRAAGYLSHTYRTGTAVRLLISASERLFAASPYLRLEELDLGGGGYVAVGIRVDRPFGAFAGGLAQIEDSLVYAGQNGRLSVFDLETLRGVSLDRPSALAGVLDLPGDAHQLAVDASGDRISLIAAPYGGGLLALDLAARSNPVVTHSVMDLPTYASSLRVDRGRIALGIHSESDASLHAYDLFRLREATGLLRSVRHKPTRTEYSSKVVSCWRESELYAVGDGTIDILDAGDVDDPRLLTSINIPGRIASIACSSDRLVAMYIPGPWSESAASIRLARYNVDASIPELVEDVEIAGTEGIVSSFPAMEIQSGLAIVAYSVEPAHSSVNGHLIVVDISDAESVRVLSEISIPGRPRSIVLEGRRAYVAATCPRLADPCGVLSIDLEAPDAPRVIGWIHYGDVGGMDALALNDGHLYVAGRDSGIWVYETDIAELPTVAPPAIPLPTPTPVDSASRRFDQLFLPWVRAIDVR